MQCANLLELIISRQMESIKNFDDAPQQAVPYRTLGNNNDVADQNMNKDTGLNNHE